ncbi:MAG: hypothetical protein ABI895_15680 [Deltaproteobacteria bacterium]
MRLERARTLFGWLLLGLALVLLPRPARALQQVSRVLPEGLIILSWPGDPSAARIVDAAQPVALGTAEVLLVPVEPGDRVRIVGENGLRPLLGLATGQSDLPDVITWDPGAGGELRLPAWSTARFIAARLPSPGALAVEVSTRTETPLAWLEWDRAVATALRGGAAPQLPDGSAAARIWQGLAVLLASVPSAERRAAADLLLLSWLEQTLRVRPLVGPYFARQGRLDFAAARELHAGERYELSAPGIDVLRWQIQAWGAARVLVREGDALSRELSFSVPAGAPPAASRPRSIRVVPPAESGRVSLEVLEGKISFDQGAWIQRREFYELLDDPVRGRRQLVELAQQARPPWVRAAATARATRNGETAGLLRLADSSPAGDLRSWLLLEAAQTERQSQTALALADRALAAARSPLLLVLALQHRRAVTPPASAGPVLPPPLRGLAQPGATPGAATEQQLWLLALHGRDALTPGTRPAWGAQLERWAALRSEDREVWASVAAFWRSIPYRSVLPSPGALTSAEYVPLEPGVDCPLPGAAPGSTPPLERFERWWFPLPGRTPLSAQLGPQHFAPLLFRPLAPAPVPESSVSLDGLSVPVHSGAGLSSEIAVSAGAHVLEVPADAPPFAVHLSDGVQVPCEQLRRVRTWTELGAGARADFELPGAGSMSVARISLAAASTGAAVKATEAVAGLGAEQELEVRVGARRLIVWGRGLASGASEVRIEAGDPLLSLIGRGATGRARVELRRTSDASGQPAAPPEPDPLPSAAATAPTDFESALLTLRELGRSLRAARGEAAVGELRGRRARLLDALGFKDLALRDAELGPASQRDGAWRPGESRRVIALSLSAKIGPLALPAATAELAGRRERLRIGGCASFGAETEPTRELGADAESLLLAYCAEQNGLTLFAARAYEAIGRAQPNGAALARAASLLADHSLDTGEPAFAFHARILGSRAALLGEDPSGLFARLGPALEWVVPNAYERAAGFATVTLAAPLSPTPGARVRRALVDAPELALLMLGDDAVQIGVKVQNPEPLKLELGCEDPSDLSCRPELRLDGARFDCPRESGPDSSCAVPLLPGEHRLELRLPSERALGWVKATLAGKLVPIRLTSRWIVVESEQPAQLTVRGPTVVVLDARGFGVAGQTIAWESCGDEPVRTYELPAGIDAGALRGGEAVTLGLPLRVDLPIETEGPCLLRFGPTRGRALFRLSVARAQGLPRPRLVRTMAAETPPPPVSPPLADALVARDLEQGPPPRELLPLLLLGRSRVVASSRSLDDEGPSGLQTPSSSYLETSVLGARELIPARFWGFGQAGLRLRDGPPSFLGRLSLDLPATSSAPGFELDTEGYWQSIDGREAFSLRSTGSLSGNFELTPNLNLLPRAAYTLDREPFRPDDLSIADSDVYSPYRESHSHYLNLELNASWRPLVDALGKLQLSTRALPDFGGLDRYGAGASWLFLPLSGGNALLDLEVGASYRPLGPYRERAFSRQSAGLGVSWWRWLSSRERLRVFGRVDGSFDAPTGPLGAPVLTVQLGVELSSSSDRGLRDLTPSSVPFVDFQERGRGGLPVPPQTGAVR